MTSEQESLLDRLAEGEVAAFERLIEPHRLELQRFAVRLLAGARCLAEEVLQEGMLNAYRAVRDGVRPENLLAWLFTVVRNCALNALRARRPEVLLDDRASVAFADVGAEVEQREWLDWLMGAILALPPRQREALVAQAFEGQSQVEIARALGTSVPAVKTLLHRARRALVAAQSSSFGAVLPALRSLRRGAVAHLKAAVPVKLGAKGAAFGWQVLALITVASGVLAVTHAGAGTAPAQARPATPGTGHPAAQPVADVQPANAQPHPSPERSAALVRLEGRRAVHRCSTGRRLAGSVSEAALRYASRHLSEDAREYTECERELASAQLAAALLKPAARNARALPAAEESRPCMHSGRAAASQHISTRGGTSCAS